MSVQKFVPIHVADVEMFYRISGNFDLLVVLDTKSLDHKSHEDSSSGEHEYKYKISCQFIKKLTYFSLDQNGGPTYRPTVHCHPWIHTASVAKKVVICKIFEKNDLSPQTIQPTFS